MVMCNFGGGEIMNDIKNEMRILSIIFSFFLYSIWYAVSSGPIHICAVVVVLLYFCVLLKFY